MDYSIQILNTRDSDLELEFAISISLSPYLLHSPSPLSFPTPTIEQRCVYTEAKNILLTRLKDSRAHGHFLLLKETEYLDMISTFLYVPNLFFLFYILTVEFDPSTITPLPKNGTRHHEKLQKNGNVEHTVTLYSHLPFHCNYYLTELWTQD